MSEHDRLHLNDNPSAETQFAVIAKTLDDVFAWLGRVEKKVDTINGSVAKVTRDQGESQHWHEMHEHSEGHAATLVRIHDIEKKFGEIERDRLIEKAAVEARTKQRNQGLTALDKAVALIVLMTPIAITLVRG